MIDGSMSAQFRPRGALEERSYQCTLTQTVEVSLLSGSLRGSGTGHQSEVF